MEVETQAGSGQGQATPDSGNTGAASTGSLTPLSDAISAAIKATEEDKSAGGEKPSGVSKMAGDNRDGEDASAASAKEPGKTEPKDEGANQASKFEAPKHWPEADRQAFSGLPQEAQALIKRLAKDLEGGFTRKSQDLGDKARYAETVRGLIDEPTRQQMAASGVNEVQYFQHLHGLQQFASRDPAGYVRWAMQSLGVTPDRLGIHAPVKQQPADAQPSQPSMEDLLSDPKVRQLEAELAALKGRQVVSPEDVQHYVANVLGQASTAQSRAHLSSVATQFRGAQDDSGQLLYPHFDTVRRQMGALMDTDPELAQMPDGPEKMKTAYDMAVYARPDLRTSFIEAEKQKAIAAAEKARDAQRARSVTAVKPAAGVATQSAKPQNLDQIIREAMGR